MNPSLLLLALRARYRIVLLTLGVTVLAALAISLTLPKNYVASASMVVNYKGVDPVTGLSAPAQLMPAYMATQVDIIQSKRVALKVVDDLQLASSPAVQAQFTKATGGRSTTRDWLADTLLQKLEVVPARESSVLTINVRGNDPELVAKVANAFANAYLDISVQLKIDPVRQANGYIMTQVKSLREQYEQAQSRLSRYQKENDIYSADNRVDVETTRLNELSTQLVTVQSQNMDAASRRRQAQGDARTSPDVMNNPLVQSLQSSLALAEAKLADTAQRLSPNHPQYSAARSEVDKLRASLEAQMRMASNSVAATADITGRRESELRAAVAAQKAKVQALNGARDEFSVLTNEMENARRAYELASQRQNQISLEGQSKQADIAVLTAATPPLQAAGPRTLVNLALAVIVGATIGLGAVLALELLDQRIRSSAHLVEAFGLPVLGVIRKPTQASGKNQSPHQPAGGDVARSVALPT